ncbi:Chromo domain-containing protein [Cephalotus follicularis]|uniref:Chromo domain-containing protein n=1 Tax=Cephalotus follicularis TaxID=3775 RepID=A0A1Q3CKP0_CEPFO|nr:Chromo domain-containing protein [Cephalotus follicularis]
MAAYKLALPPDLSNAHDIFHVSMLRKYQPDPSHVLQWEPLQLGQDMNFVETPVRILDYQTKQLRSKNIPLAKVLWQYHGIEEATWECEDDMKATYPYLF